MADFSEPVFLPVGVTAGPVTRPLREQIEAAVARAIPKGKAGVVLGVATEHGMQLAAAHRIGDRWKLAGEVSRKWGGKVSGQVMVVGSW